MQQSYNVYTVLNYVNLCLDILTIEINITSCSRIASEVVCLFIVRPRFEDITVPVNGTAGNSIILTCNSTGVPEPSITWLKDGSPLTSTPDESVILTESLELSSGIQSVTSTLQLLGLVLNDTSNYSCKADNDLARPQTELSEELELSILCKTMHYS